MQVKYLRAPGAFVLALIVALAPLPTWASPGAVSRALKDNDQTNRAAAQSQKRIDRLDDQSRKLLHRYEAVLRRTQQLQAYDKQLKELLSTQADRRKSLESQLHAVARTRQQLTPMMLRMIDMLQRFVKADVPFRFDQRRQHIKQLRSDMSDPDKSLAGRYRAILTAYRKEVGYGRSIGTYKGQLPGKDGGRTVQFLRLGRVELYYLALNGSDCGYWNRRSDSWQPLPGRYRSAIRKGIRLARKQSAPSLLELPVPAPEAGQ